MEVSPDTRRSVFKRGVAALKKAGIENPALDAAVLLAYATGDPPAEVLLEGELCLEPSENFLYRDLVLKRCERVALSRLLGTREFYSRNFHITDDVLDPRPETEILVEQAIAFLESRKGSAAVIDVGTGSGAIAVTVAAQVPRARVTATDISRAALYVARRNAAFHCVLDRVHFLQSDLLNAIRPAGGFGLILSNPPYIPRALYDDLQEEVRNGDPVIALVPGPEGTECYPLLAQRSMELLDPEGSLMVEVGHGQDRTVAGIFLHAGFREVEVVSDLAGTGRVVMGKKKNA